MSMNLQDHMNSEVHYVVQTIRLRMEMGNMSKK